MITTIEKRKGEIMNNRAASNNVLDIIMAVPGMTINPDTLEKKSLGGSETAGVSMAMALANRGHDVILFCQTDSPGKSIGKALLAPIDNFAQYASTCHSDVVIVQRLPEIFTGNFASKLNVLWQHDLALHRQRQVFGGVQWNIDKVAVVSEWMKKQYQEVYGLGDYYVTRNGIDLSLVPASRPFSTRKRKTLVYAARPERGLDVMLDRIFPELLKRDPELELVICGYDNTVPQMAPFYDRLFATMKQFGDKVKWLGHLSKKQLYSLYQNSGVYVYPTPSPEAPSFHEVSCISAMEAMACGLPFVTSDRGALSETLHPDACVLVKGTPADSHYVDDFVEAVLSITGTSLVGNAMSLAGIAHAKTLSWDSLAEEWERDFVEFIQEKNSNPIRRALHFIRHSDIFAASEAIKDEASSEADNVRKLLEDNWGFRHSEEALSKHYEEMGRVTDDFLSKQNFEGFAPYFENSQEYRFKMIETALGKLPANSDLILDYGCGHGWSTVYLANKTGRRFIGVDIDPGAIAWADRFNDRFGKKPERSIFYTLDDYLQRSAGGSKDVFEAAIVSDVLEHCIDPVKTIEGIENKVRIGGRIYITVPFGPREYSDFTTIKHRNHLWELDGRTLKTMFKDKPDIEMASIFEKFSPELNEPMGFYWISYKADHKPVGKIDMDRKQRIARPSQTVTLSMICGKGSEQTLDWCLSTARPIVDDIIIADCGMSQEAVNIALKYNAQIVPGANPIEHGFDEARNSALPFVKTDWILWLDSDERLLDGVGLFKYLRENCYHGYSIQQHHFAVDTSFKPDLPVRLFRNRPFKHTDGTEYPMKWHGSIHEHPEAGLNKGPGLSLILPDVHIGHVGYMIESGRKERFWRNHPLLLKSIEKHPDRELNYHFLMRDYSLLNSYELSANRGIITPTIRERAQKIIDMYRERFAGKPMPLNAGVLDYYSQACRILGLGFEASLSLGFAKDTVPSSGITQQYRFANIEDFMKELSFQVKMGAESFCSDWY